MTTEASQPLKITGTAGENLSTYQYCFVKYDTNGKIVHVSAAADRVIGVLQNNPNASGKSCEIVVVGVTKVVAGGTIAIGADISPGASATAITAAPTGLGTGYVQGTKQIVGFLYAAGPAAVAAASGDICSAVVDCTQTTPGT